MARILVVDDDRDLREVVAEALGEDGFEVAVAGDAAEGLAKLRDLRPAAVFLDLQMPGDGRELLKACRRDPLVGYTPVAILSGLPESQRVANELHVDAWIGKPFDLDELRATARYLVALDGKAPPAAPSEAAPARRLAPPAGQAHLLVRWLLDRWGWLPALMAIALLLGLASLLLR